MRHPGQIRRFAMGSNKSWDASRDPEGTEFESNFHKICLSRIPELISPQDEIRPE